MNVETLAEALCITSHHGLTRTEWPCEYHRERAEAALKWAHTKRLTLDAHRQKEGG